MADYVHISCSDPISFYIIQKALARKNAEISSDMLLLTWEMLQKGGRFGRARFFPLWQVFIQRSRTLGYAFIAIYIFYKIVPSFSLYCTTFLCNICAIYQFIVLSLFQDLFGCHFEHSFVWVRACMNSGRRGPSSLYWPQVLLPSQSDHRTDFAAGGFPMD